MLLTPYLLRFERSVERLRVVFLSSSSSSSLLELELVDVVDRLRELDDDERLTLGGGVLVFVDRDLVRVDCRCLARSTLLLLTRELDEERVRDEDDEYADPLCI